MPRRERLDPERIVTAAVSLADESGAEGVTMRAVARRVGVEAMSLYHHVRGREAMLDGMVDVVFAEIVLPEPTVDWRDAMRVRAVSAREALRRHPWAVGLMDSRRQPGPATLQHHDAVLGLLRAGGFSVAGAIHAFSAVDSYVYGFVLQEVSLPFSTPDELETVADEITAQMPVGLYPHLAEVMEEQVRGGTYAYADEFAIGLDLILGALDPDAW